MGEEDAGVGRFGVDAVSSGGIFPPDRNGSGVEKTRLGGWGGWAAGVARRKDSAAPLC